MASSARPALPGPGSWLWPWLWPVALVLGAALATGLAGGLVVLGTVALAVATDRHVPALRGPAVWACAVLLEIGLLSLSSVALPLVSDGPVSRLLAVVALAFPAAFATLALVVPQRANAHPDREPGQRPERSTQWLAAALAPLSVLAVGGLLSLRGRGFAAAWAMSGDSRNHVTLMWQLGEHGGVRLDDLRGYPVIIDGLAMLLSTAAGRDGLPPGQQLLHDAGGLAHTYLLIAAALAALFGCAVLETVRVAREDTRQRLGLPVVLTVAVLSAVLVSSALVTNTALYGGFLTGYGGAAVTMAALVLTIRGMTAPSWPALLLVAASGPLLLGVWSILALLVPALVLLVAVRGLLVRPRPAGWLWATISAPALAAIPVVAIVTQWDTLGPLLSAPGTIIRPRPAFLLLLAAVSIGLVAGGRWWSRWSAAPPLLVLASGLAIIGWLRTFGPDGTAWTYYATKMLWLVDSLVLWVLVIPIAALVAVPSATATATATGARWVRRGAAVACSAAIVICLAGVTTLPQPVREAWSGWNQPRAAGIARLETVADAREPFVFWYWTDNGSVKADARLNDRILNFWSAALFDSPAAGAHPGFDPALLPGGMSAWAVNAFGEPERLCALARAVPRLTVLTRDAGLSARFAPACPGSTVRFRVDASSR